MKLIITFGLLAATTRVFMCFSSADDFVPRNSQNPEDVPPTAEEVVAMMTVPEGFKVQIFAAEPDVRQPIAMNFDDRGRLWVAEAYSYGEWEKRGEDRILIFEDDDQDGKFDTRKVFIDGLDHLSGFNIGFGGVWICNSPDLLFVPDRNHDDVPDGDAEVVLMGWTTEQKHNMFNGLKWGPDGWLYGRHGVLGVSQVGPPGSKEDDRMIIDCGIWRLHPVTRKLEKFNYGMTNPWGMDWDKNGEMFLSGNVNGHLWHSIAGARYVRMFGAGLLPHSYDRISMIGEREHYEGTGDWQRDWNNKEYGRDSANDLGGGHSHCGAMIYLGDNWPAQYRGEMFMFNTHGARVNQDSIKPKSSTFTSVYERDLLRANTPWFKGVTLLYGPDGTVFLSDWVDFGECHDSDGVHRGSGRIYRISFGNPDRVPKFDLQKLSDLELVELQRSVVNEWWPRHARRVLQERAAQRALSVEGRELLNKGLAPANDTTELLRAMWCAYAVGELPDQKILPYLEDDRAAVQTWAVRLLTDDSNIDETTARQLARGCGTRFHQSAKLALASSLSRLSSERIRQVHRPLLAQDHPNDPALSLTIWHGVERLANEDLGWAVIALKYCDDPMLQNYLARRVFEELGQGDDNIQEAAKELLTTLLDQDPLSQKNALQGALDALQGRRGVVAPLGWAGERSKLLNSPDIEIHERAIQLGALFKDPEALKVLRGIVADAAQAAETRRSSLSQLIAVGDEESEAKLEILADDSVLGGVAISALGDLHFKNLPKLILDRFASMPQNVRSTAIDTLTKRPEYAKALLDALADGGIERNAISASHAQQMAAFRDSEIAALLDQHWGAVRSSSADKKQEIARLQAILVRETDPAAVDFQKGRGLFTQRCSACHELFGEGGKVGPNLTGSDRKNVGYLLENIIDPSASVPGDYQMSIVSMKDGRVLTGAVMNRRDPVVRLRMMAEELKIDGNEIDEIKGLGMSLMPEGLLNGLSEEELVDLFGYLRSQ